MLRLLSLLSLFSVVIGTAIPVLHQNDGRTVSLEVFESLEELARIVDIAYCVGFSGIQKPFSCLSRCSEFEGFELVTTWNTGPLLSDSCGYIVLSHAPNKKRVIIAFRGTYSIANTIADLSTNPAVYTPFPADGGGNGSACTQVLPPTEQQGIIPQLLRPNIKRSEPSEKCSNCTVHSGFMTSWHNTRCTIISVVEKALAEHPDYELTLVGHSLGGAVAALAGLEFQARGWTPHITTFGEPKIGNKELNEFIDRRFNLNAMDANDALYRRVTHAEDPVPLLPLQEWGYRMHAGEIFISKTSLPPARSDLEHCTGDADPKCIAAGEVDSSTATDITDLLSEFSDEGPQIDDNNDQRKIVARSLWSVPKRMRFWQLFFAHRDYFWRLGLCVPGGDPWDWKRPKYDFGNATSTSACVDGQADDAKCRPNNIQAMMEADDDDEL